MIRSSKRWTALAAVAAIVLASAEVSAVPLSGLQGYWKADGDAGDSSGNGNTGTFTGGATTVPGGISGSAFSFDGINDSITPVGTAGGSLDIAGSGLTVAAWINPSATQNANPSNPMSIFDKYFNGIEDGYVLLLTGDGNLNPGVLLGDGDEGASVIASVSIPVGTFSHVAASYDGTFVRLFVNAAKVHSVDLSTAQPSFGGLASHSLAAAIGNDNGGTVAFGFTGLIDELVVYDRALSKAEINQLAGVPPVPTSVSPFVLGLLLLATTHRRFFQRGT